MKDTTKWDAEVDYFAKNVILKRLTVEDISEAEELGFDVADAVKDNIPDLIPDLRNEQLKENFVTPETTPEDFEHWCKGILLSNGWTARTTSEAAIRVLT